MPGERRNNRDRPCGYSRCFYGQEPNRMVIERVGLEPYGVSR